MDFQLLLDSPGEPKNRIQIAKLGDDFQHGKYGKFAITTGDVETWQKNLSQLPGHRAVIVADHQADRTPRNTEASGWITGVSLDGDTPMAEVEWTSKGEQAIRDKRYLFISPTFGPFKDEHGNVHENTLIGAALTNRPFLNMPSLCLASEERVSEAIDADPAARFRMRALDGEYGDNARSLVLLDLSTADRKQAASDGHALPDGSYPVRDAKELHAAAILASSGHGDSAAAKALIRRRAKDLGVDVTTLPGFATEKKLDTNADSRPPMDAETLIKTLDLEAGADDAAILAKLAELQANTPAEPKTLEQQAQDQGLVLLDANTVSTLQRQAAAGEAANKQLHEQRFETAFTLALEDTQGPRVTPAEKDDLHHFYTLDADATIKLIENRKPIIPAKPAGAPSLVELDGDDVDAQTLAAHGIHPEGHQIDRMIQDKLREKGLPQTDYPKLLDQYMREGVI